MILILVPALVAIVGALVYALSSNARVVELGRLAYAVGLFWAVYALAGHVLKLV